MRKSGILMHVSSLPGRYGCGNFGKEAYAFVDFMKKAGFSVWQTLPFSMPDRYGSPYKSYSAFAGNPWFIDPETLFENGLLTKTELRSAEQETPWKCEFERLDERLGLLSLATERFGFNVIGEFLKNNPHIEQFCRFMALKKANGGKDLQDFDPKIAPDEKTYRLHAFCQYEFDRQWQKLKKYANDAGISVIGDLPIYVDRDSADVYESPENFQLDENLRPERVAGVPPDYFSKDGQLWGNPLYDWDYMKKDGYRWWRARMERAMHLFDGVRIDHFRGFSAYFSIGADEKTAKNGKWVKGPGLDFVNVLKEVAGDKTIIAEDLGVVDEDLSALLKASKLPGMRVFQFGFIDGDDHHRPHAYPENCVAYTGTHDNNTLLGYLWELDDPTRRYMLDYCAHTGDWKSGCETIVRTVFRSAAQTVILPIQDVLGYGADTRMNIPGNPDGNWRYRLTAEQLFGIDTDRWLYLNQLYARI